MFDADRIHFPNLPTDQLDPLMVLAVEDTVLCHQLILS
jgi:hypothetical protein